MSHAQAGLVEATRRIVALENCLRSRIENELPPEGAGDRSGRNVVMCRPNAARREHVIIARTAFVDCGDELRLEIGDHAGLAQANAKLGQLARKIAEVGILSAARQDLMADAKRSGGDE